MPLCLAESFFVVASCENFTYLRILISTLVVITLQCISALFAGEQWTSNGLLVDQEPASGSVGRWVVWLSSNREDGLGLVSWPLRKV